MGSEKSFFEPGGGKLCAESRGPGGKAKAIPASVMAINQMRRLWLTQPVLKLELFANGQRAEGKRVENIQVGIHIESADVAGATTLPSSK